jgi:tetratricopeptide (TPR) repeat protein
MRPNRENMVVRKYKEWSADPPPEPLTPPRERRRSRRMAPLFAGVLFMALVVAASFWAGRESVSRAPVADPGLVPAAREVMALPPEVLDALDDAMARLRSGKPGEGLGMLEVLLEEHPEVSSLRYAMALAAIDAGDLSSATSMAGESVKRGEKVSDALALLAVLDREKERAGIPSIAPPEERARSHLEQAIAADPLNPRPRIEIADALRRRGQIAQAAGHLRAALNLMEPVDGRLVAEATLAILEIEQDGDIADRPRIATLLARATEAANSGNDSLATSLLAELESLLAPETFAYLVGDPSLRKHAHLEGVGACLNRVKP